jgi:hypothetical protein
MSCVCVCVCQEEYRVGSYSCRLDELVLSKGGELTDSDSGSGSGGPLGSTRALLKDVRQKQVTARLQLCDQVTVSTNIPHLTFAHRQFAFATGKRTALCSEHLQVSPVCLCCPPCHGKGGLGQAWPCDSGVVGVGLDDHQVGLRVASSFVSAQLDNLDAKLTDLQNTVTRLRAKARALCSRATI